MADKPILFSAAMVRALMDGRKSMTRRIIKPQPAEIVTSAGHYWNSIDGDTGQWSWLSGDPRDCDTWGFEGDFKLRFVTGDRLYVREHWRTLRENYEGLAPRYLHNDAPILYIADGSIVGLPSGDRTSLFGKHRQAMHMPRWASRLTLTVTDVRVQRLQECSEEDAIAEGIERIACSCSDGVTRNLWHGIPQVGNEGPVQAYADLWDSINNPRGYCADDCLNGWVANPWVAAVSFSVDRRNIDG